MGKFKDLTGQRFGHLTAIKRVQNQGIHTVWECLCDCGNTTFVRANNLTRKTYQTTSCGCRTGTTLLNKQYGELVVIEDLGMVNKKHMYKCKCSCGNIKNVSHGSLTSGKVTTCGDRQTHNIRPNWNNLIGERFGRLTVIEETSKRIDGRVVWKCKCDCGNITEVISKNLLSGNTLSCGCYHIEQTINDLAGEKFVLLTVIKDSGIRTESRGVVWECLCDCGTTCYKSGNLLVSGGVKSCGCLISYGEEKIRKLFNDNNIKFETQKSYDSCRFANNRLAHFDFYIEDNYLLEYDGVQHFVGWDWNEDSLKIQQERDEYKNKWCKENGIPLVRIPYTKLETLCLEDLLLETTKYRVV